MFVEIIFRVRTITFRSTSLFKMQNRYALTHIFHEMQNGIHDVDVEGRMKVEDGGKRGVTQPYWLRIVGQHDFPCGVSWRSIPQETIVAKPSATASTRAAQRAALPAANDAARRWQSELMQW